MSRRVIPKGLITNQPASSKGATWYRGVGALNRSVYRHLLINAALPQPFPPTTAPTIGKGVASHLSFAFAITTLSQNAQYYEYSLDNGATWTQYNVLNIADEPYVLITNLTNGQTYNITLRGVGRAGPGPASNVLTDTVNNQKSVLQFTTAGTIVLSGPAKGTLINYVLVGGGGGSGATYDNGTSGGGGGGMVRQGSFVADGTTAYTITVGAGGSGGGFAPANPQPTQLPGNPGQASSIVGGTISVSALGGLGGAPSRGDGAGGSQSIPPNTAATGGNGGGGMPNNSAGGGGGAGGDGTAGTVGDGAVGGAGGSGLFVTLGGVGGVTGTFGAGGNGASNTKTNVQGSSASPASGNGGNGSSAGSSSDINGANGGSGVVWVYY